MLSLPYCALEEKHTSVFENNIHSNYKKKNEEMPMGAVSAFTTGNFHCKPLMTDVIVIHITDVTVIHQVNI